MILQSQITLHNWLSGAWWIGHCWEWDPRLSDLPALPSEDLGTASTKPSQQNYGSDDSPKPENTTRLAV